VSYTATVNAAAVGTVNNAVVGNQGDCEVDCDIETPVEEPSDRKSDVEGKGGPVAEGGRSSETLTAKVSEAQVVADLGLTDTQGTGLDLGTVTPVALFTCNSGHPLVCRVWGGEVCCTDPVSYTATVIAAALGTVNNAVVGNQGDCEVDCDIETPVEEPSVTYNKTADTAGPASVGDTITYTLTATVSESQLVTDLVLTDTLGTGLDLGTVTPVAPFTCNSANPLACTLPAGTVPGTYTVSYTATVNAAAVGTVNNAVVGNQGDCEVDCDIETPVEEPPVTYNKTADTAGPVSVGDTITY